MVTQKYVEEKYGAVTFKVFYDYNNQKLQVEGKKANFSFYPPKLVAFSFIPFFVDIILDFPTFDKPLSTPSMDY